MVTFRIQEAGPAPIRLSGRFSASNLRPAPPQVGHERAFDGRKIAPRNVSSNSRSRHSSGLGRLAQRRPSATRAVGQVLDCKTWYRGHSGVGEASRRCPANEAAAETGFPSTFRCPRAHSGGGEPLGYAAEALVPQGDWEREQEGLKSARCVFRSFGEAGDARLLKQARCLVQSMLQASYDVSRV